MTIIYRKVILIAALFLLSAGAGQAGAAEKKLSPLSDSLRKVSRTPAFSTREAFRKFSQKQGKGWKVRYSPRTALPEAITGGSTVRYPGTPENAAAAFFADNADLLKLDPAALRLVTKKEFMGVTHLQYQQYKDGLPVEFAYARVHVASDGSVSGFQGKFEPDITVNSAPAVTAEAAVMYARADLGRQLSASRVELVIFPDADSGSQKLAWKIRGRGNGLWVYYVDASNGSVLFKYDDLRRACPGYTGAVGSSSGAVYAISPIPTDPNSNTMTDNNWDLPLNLALRDQYVWVNSYSSMSVTNQYGDYCTNTPGKVFSSLKGPYFSVTNFRGDSAHWDNAVGATWESPLTPVQSLHPYADSQNYSFAVTIPDNWTSRGLTFAKALPHFTAGFQAGEMDIFGSINDGDQLAIKSGALTGENTVGAYTGLRRNAFYGASVESPSYSLALKTDASGTYNGFTVDNTKVLLLPADHATTDNASGSVLWDSGQSRVTVDASQGAINARSEANAFYHLNKARRYFDVLNLDPNTGSPAADLSKRVAVMVRAHGDADMLGGTCGTGCGGMLNAFYDLENDNIMLGDGPLDPYGKYRSFALDGTIVRHEYIHLVVNRIYPIVNFGEFGAISEGLADYFALASFWSEGRSIDILGNFIGSGEGSARNLLTDTDNCGGDGKCVMPADWVGEVHTDSMMLSQALYSLRPGGTRDIGTFGVGAYTNLRKADVLAYAALFYFPDNFANYYEAMIAACKQFNTTWAGSCDATAQGKIFNALYTDHGIGAVTGGDLYEFSDPSSMCTTNNGPECASEIANDASILANVYPLGDVDYYSVPLAAGDVSAQLTLPAGSQDGTYNAYGMFLFDANRDYVTEATPEVYNTGTGYCPDAGECLTLSPTVTLRFNIPRAGRYYLVVSAAPNQYYGNSEANSTAMYTLKITRTQAGSATANIFAGVFDNDQINFDVPYTAFPMVSAPSSATLTSKELVFEYAQLRDHNYDPIDLTRTNLTGAYMKDIPSARNFSTNAFGVPVVSGRVQLQPGFAARYPGVGTVYVELFGRNHLGHLVSLGVSNAVNLSGSGPEAVAYNNIITGEGDAAIIKYSVTGAGTLSVKVYTQSGSLVKTVYSGPVPAGKGTLDWDGKNSSGAKVASGIYFVKTKGPGLDKIVKIAVVR
jgi:Zn-dependent metalloprotease